MVMCVCVWGEGYVWGRSGKIHLTKRKTITALLLNDSPNHRLKQRSNKSIRRCSDSSKPPLDEPHDFECSNYYTSWAGQIYVLRIISTKPAHHVRLHDILTSH